VERKGDINGEKDVAIVRSNILDGKRGEELWWGFVIGAKRGE